MNQYVMLEDDCKLDIEYVLIIVREWNDDNK